VTSPDEFAYSGEVRMCGGSGSPHTMTNRGLHIELKLIPISLDDIYKRIGAPSIGSLDSRERDPGIKFYQALLECTVPKEPFRQLAIYLSTSDEKRFVREFSETVTSVDLKCILDRIKQTSPSSSRLQNLTLHADAPDLAQKAAKRWIYITSPYEDRVDYSFRSTAPTTGLDIRIKIISSTSGVVISNLFPSQEYWEELKTAENYTEFCCHVENLEWGNIGCIIFCICTEDELENQYLAAVFGDRENRGDCSYAIVDITQEYCPPAYRIWAPSSAYKTERTPASTQPLVHNTSRGKQISMFSVADENGDICPNVVIEWKDTIEASEQHQAPRDDDVLTCRFFVDIEESASMYSIWSTYTGQLAWTSHSTAGIWGTSVPADEISIELNRQDQDCFGLLRLRSTHKQDSFSDTGDIVIFLMFYETLTIGCHAVLDTQYSSLDNRRETLIDFTYSAEIADKGNEFPANSSLDIGDGKSIHVKLVKRDTQPGTLHIADVFISLSDTVGTTSEGSGKLDQDSIDSSESHEARESDDNPAPVTSELSLSRGSHSSTLETTTKRSRESPISSSDNHNQNESEGEGQSEGKVRVHKKAKATTSQETIVSKSTSSEAESTYFQVLVSEL
jgi:hypothetical protein